MTRAAAMIFTWPPDALTARQAVDQLRKVHPEVKVYVSVEPVHWGSFPTTLFQDCTLVTGAAGRYNLNGLTHLRDAAALASRAVAEGAEVVLKMDSDVLVLQDDLVPAHVAGGKGMTGYEIGTAGYRPGYIGGPFYAWSPEFVAALVPALREPSVVEYLLDWEKKWGQGYLPEDMSFQVLADHLGHGHTRLPGLFVAEDMKRYDFATVLVMRHRRYTAQECRSAGQDAYVRDMRRLLEMLRLRNLNA